MTLADLKAEALVQVDQLRRERDEARAALREVVECLSAGTNDTRRLDLAPVLAHADGLIAKWGKPK